MALKPDRYERSTDIRWFMDAVAERGGVVSIKTTGSGGYPGQTLNVAEYKADPSGAKPLGFLVQDVVDFDTNRQHENFFKGGYQQRKGTKVCLVTDGFLTTNMIIGTPTAGADAFLAASGNISPTQATGAPKVGTFDTTKDQDGYAQVTIKL